MPQLFFTKWYFCSGVRVCDSRSYRGYSLVLHHPYCTNQIDSCRPSSTVIYTAAALKNSASLPSSHPEPFSQTQRLKHTVHLPPPPGLQKTPGSLSSRQYTAICALRSDNYYICPKNNHSNVHPRSDLSSKLRKREEKTKNI